jgi:hypothetical protein
MLITTVKPMINKSGAIERTIILRGILLIKISESPMHKRAKKETALLHKKVATIKTVASRILKRGSIL